MGIGSIIKPSNLEQLKQAIDDGHEVYHHNTAYRVIKDKIGQYLIVHQDGHAIGLTWRDGITLNGKLEDFLIVILP